MTQVTDKTQIFLQEVVRKRPQDSAGHHAVVHPISPSVSRDGGLPSGGHLFPPAGHLLELHQSNVSHSTDFSCFFSLCPPHLFRVIIFYDPTEPRVMTTRIEILYTTFRVDLVENIQNSNYRLKRGFFRQNNQEDSYFTRILRRKLQLTHKHFMH